MKPLEKTILKDFGLSKFIVCTDAGLASEDNRKYNSLSTRAFITTQSIKKLKAHLKEWALATTGWSSNDDKQTYDISKVVWFQLTLAMISAMTFTPQLDSALTIKSWDRSR